MTTWNYRVIRTPDNESDAVYQIKEVYYDDDGTIREWSVQPDAAGGEDLDGLKGDLLLQLAALDKPVLEEVNDGNRYTLIESL